LVAERGRRWRGLDAIGRARLWYHIKRDFGAMPNRLAGVSYIYRVRVTYYRRSTRTLTRTTTGVLIQLQQCLTFRNQPQEQSRACDF
jgi:hypothetical protein